MRSKEEAHGYRYFPEPDLPPLVVDVARIDAVPATMPELPEARRLRFVAAYGIPEYGFLVGQVMKGSKGKANPKLASDLLKRELEGA